MSYVTATLTPVPEDQKDRYIAGAARVCALFREYGALETRECWEDGLSEGAQTSFPRAVQRQPGEAVVLTWIIWPDKATCDRCMVSFATDPRWAEVSVIPLDGQRMIFGGFAPVFSGSL